jgi:hypothetical protein
MMTASILRRKGGTELASVRRSTTWLAPNSVCQGGRGRWEEEEGRRGARGEAAVW